MHEIKCPQCGATFKVDESSYADIVKQVHDKEFNEQLHERLEAAEQDKQKAVELTKIQAKGTLQETTASKDAEIQKLKAQLEQNESAQKLAINDALKPLEEKVNSLTAQLDQAKHDRQAALDLAQSKATGELDKAIAKKDAEITTLKSQISEAETAKQHEISEAVSAAEKERDQFKIELDRANSEKENAAKLAAAEHQTELQKATASKNSEIQELRHSLDEVKLKTDLEAKSLKERYETQIQDRDDQIERLRDLKSKLSTKMIGESLEQHCMNEFNKIRATAFPTAYFEKDNDISKGGTKGDFIFRENDEAGNEVVSIMFEMKNENDDDERSKKHKNEDFFKKLDNDRHDKSCEYAVLVTMLEPDSDLYNTGIVDVSYRYEKMYVIRPQFFIPMITVLRNAALNSMQYKKQLADERAQNIDITNFEDQLSTFKDAFGKNVDLAARKFNTAIEEIDKSITHLNKIRENLVGSQRNLKLASKKAENVTIRKLTRGNETMKKKFEEAAKPLSSSIQ